VALPRSEIYFVLVFVLLFLAERVRCIKRPQGVHSSSPIEVKTRRKTWFLRSPVRNPARVTFFDLFFFRRKMWPRRSPKLQALCGRYTKY